MDYLRIGVLVALLLAFSYVTAEMLIEWLATGIQRPHEWQRLLIAHILLGHALAGFAAVLVGWRTALPWLGALGWAACSRKALFLRL
jgi:hypothetical protein